jgi:hypothetical protein
MKEQEKNSWEVLKYLESWHSIEPSLMGSDEPYDHKAKGSSRPPCSDNALDLMHANAEARTILAPILERLEGTAYGGVVKAIRHDPSAIPNWRAAQGRPWRMVRGLCRIVARSVAKHHDTPEGPYRLRVAVSRREIEDALRDPREKTNGTLRTYTAHYSYRIIDAEIERLISEGYSEMAARQYLMDRGTSAPRISRARAFVREERGVA